MRLVSGGVAELPRILQRPGPHSAGLHLPVPAGSARRFDERVLRKTLFGWISRSSEVSWRGEGSGQSRQRVPESGGKFCRRTSERSLAELFRGTGARDDGG